VVAQRRKIPQLRTVRGSSRTSDARIIRESVSGTSRAHVPNEKLAKFNEAWEVANAIVDNSVQPTQQRERGPGRRSNYYIRSNNAPLVTHLSTTHTTQATCIHRSSDVPCGNKTSLPDGTTNEAKDGSGIQMQNSTIDAPSNCYVNSYRRTKKKARS